ncbi:unnamed protein product [Phytophthora fragariaefolia]|uniref:Unnamed protein product n=1 Tax=Phytophthora fragariaefolia TaxID=1490495 RepID=A0A9W6XPU7_9STRA|nr:unnamed protein product [Phytophthora fragariaefolia]
MRALGLTLSHWGLEVRTVQRDEDGLAAILGAGITPREHPDEVAETLIPGKGRVKAPPAISVKILDDSYTGYVLSFDGTAKMSTRQGSCGCVVWELPGWRAPIAYGFILPNLQRQLAEYEALKVKFKSVKLVHVKRAYNQAVDCLTSQTLALGESWQVEDAEELRHLEQVSKIPEKWMKSEASLNVPVHEGSGQSPPDGVPLNDDHPGPVSTTTHCSQSNGRCGDTQPYPGGR